MSISELYLILSPVFIKIHRKKGKTLLPFLGQKLLVRRHGEEGGQPLMKGAHNGREREPIMAMFNNFLTEYILKHKAKNILLK